MLSRRRFISASLGLGISSIARTGLTAPYPDHLAVVVSANSPLRGLSLFSLRRLYLGDWVEGPRGGKLIPLNRGLTSPERAMFEREVLRMSADEVASHWIARRIRGESGAPKAIEPASVLVRVINNLPGGMGYLFSRDLDSTVRPVAIDGKLPGDRDYPLLVLGSNGDSANPMLVSDEQK